MIDNNDASQYVERINNILEQYNAEDGLSYAQANIMVDQETQEFLMHYLQETPDEVLEVAYSAYASLQVQAYNQGDISQSEASNLISQRSVDLFSLSRSPEEIEKLWEPFEKLLYPDDAEEQQSDMEASHHSGLDDRDGFFGAFSLN
tara:strand:+ start:52765 stop:53205 length:441 start_codon:yes stop_codon:yes gene_type:complete